MATGRWISLLAVLLTIAGARAARAAETPRDSVLYATVLRYASGDRLFRVDQLREVMVVPSSAVTRAGLRIDRRSGSGPADSIAEDLIPWSNVRQVEISASSWKTGLAIGSGVGLLSGLVLASTYRLATILSQPRSGRGKEGVIIIVGTVTGAAVGALLAAPFRHWRVIYPAHPKDGEPH